MHEQRPQNQCQCEEKLIHVGVEFASDQLISATTPERQVILLIVNI